MIKELKKMLIRHEGEVNHAYEDSEGYITIGIGRLIDKRKGGGISHAEAMYLLDNDIIEATSQCQREFPWFHLLDDARQLVVLNMVFNMGITTFKKFKKTIYFIKIGDYSAASKEMLDSQWRRQVGNRALELSRIMETGEI